MLFPVGCHWAMSFDRWRPCEKALEAGAMRLSPFVLTMSSIDRRGVMAMQCTVMRHDRGCTDPTSLLLLSFTNEVGDQICCSDTVVAAGRLHFEGHRVEAAASTMYTVHLRNVLVCREYSGRFAFYVGA